MTPEEKFNQEVWFVLNKIKKHSFYSGKDGVVKYWIKSPPNLKVEGMPFPVEEMAVVNKLQDWGAIKIISPDDIAEVGSSEEALSKGENVFIVIQYLKINKPKFDEIYTKFQNAIDKNASEFLEVEKNFQLSVADRKKLCVLEKLKEEWDLAPDRVHISSKKYSQWCIDCNADFHQLYAILDHFRKEGLINSFLSVDESR